MKSVDERIILNGNKKEKKEMKNSFFYGFCVKLNRDDAENEYFFSWKVVSCYERNKKQNKI